MQIRREERDGSHWIVKTAFSEAEAGRLRHEAAQLGRAAHPGVVEVGHRHDDDAVELWTRAVGHDLAAHGPLSTAQICGLGAAVATVLADLHDMGLVHGAVRAEHILVGDDGRPVLCGFGDSGPVGPHDPAVDVGDLLHVLSNRAGPDVPRPLQRVLRAGPARRRPVTARALAAGLARAVPDWSLPSSSDLPGAPSDTDPADTGSPHTGSSHTGSPHTGSPDLGPALAIGAADARLAAGPALSGDPLPGHVVAGGGAPASHEWPVGRRGRVAAPPRRRSGPRLVAAVTIAAVAVAALLLSRAVGSSRSAGSGTCPPQDQGCDPLPVRGGAFVTASGRFAVGIADPIVVVGRWDCGHEALPAALDPHDGRVWVWPAWAGSVGTVAADAMTTQPGARSLRVIPSTDTCDRLEVIGPGRAAVTFEPTRRRRG